MSSANFKIKLVKIFLEPATDDDNLLIHDENCYKPNNWQPDVDHAVSEKEIMLLKNALSASINKVVNDTEKVKPMHEFKPRFTREEIRRMQQTNDDDMRQF